MTDQKTMSPEERAAWDAVVASTLPFFDLERPDLAAALAGKVADAMIEERRKRCPR